MSEKAQNTDHSFVVPQLPHFHPHSAGGHQESLGAGQNTKIPAPLTDLHPIANRFVVEVLKNGLICETVNVNKSVVVIGRALDCDIVLQHPSLSRYHAAIMWKENQAQPNDKNGFFYLMDLHSAHGTFLNKQRLDENKCVKLIVGNNVIRVGGSTRTLILSKIQTDDEEEDDDEQFVESQRKTQESGCRWGMQMEPDDVEPTESSEADDLLNNPVESLQQLIASKVKLESTKNSEVYVENAQKVIQQWFESEGFVFEYRIETFNEQMKCTLSFPIEGQDVEISGDLSMKKKDAIAAACLRSCQLLDQVGILFPWQSTQDTKRKSKANRGEDDDDDCDMIDETGESELKQAKKQAARQNRAETLDSLNAKWTETCEQLQKLKSKLVRISMHDPGRPETMPSSGAELDALESYMSSIQNQDGNTSRMANKIEKSKLKMQISQLTKEQARLERLIKIAKPSFKLPDMPKMMISSKAKDLLAKAQQKLQKHASAIADVVGTSNQSTADLSSPLHSSLEPKSQSTINAESDVCKSSQVSDDKNLHEIDLSATSKTEQKRSNKSHSQSASTSAFSNVSTSAISTLTTTVSSSSSFSNINLKLGSIHTVEKPAEFANATQTVGETRSQRKGGLNLCSSADNPNKKIKPIPASKRTATSATYLDDSAYVEWTPPTDQSGDGKTSLNKKFGY